MSQLIPKDIDERKDSSFKTILKIILCWELKLTKDFSKKFILSLDRCLQEKLLGLFGKEELDRIKEHFIGFGLNCSWIKRLEGLKKESIGSGAKVLPMEVAKKLVNLVDGVSESYSPLKGLLESIKVTF